MTPERWQKVERLYHAALEHDNAARSAFLADACAGDDGLRKEVESLLAQQSGAAGFMSISAPARAGELMREGGTSLIGRTLGPYSIQARLGAGGMGEVYRARDTKLGREVAIKILPKVFTTDRDRLARFEREARVLASLNHTHIGAIYGLESIDGTPALVLELVEGETLAERIAKKPLPLAEALPIARQIADALDAAHERGIIHRDLKPANIKVRPDGTVKVLDFGLAKAMEPAGASSANAMNSPTLSVHATQGGIILGTAAYMSPEQAAGKPVDKRSDLWSFGVVLLEMLTGGQVFAGETVSQVLAAVLTKEPAWTALPARTPVAIRTLLRRCLEKDRKRRLDSAADARLEIEDAIAAPTPDALPAAPVRHRLLLALAGAVALAAIITGAFAMRFIGAATGRESNPAVRGLTRSLISVTPADQLRANSGVENLGEGRPSQTAMVLTPDGRSLVFSAIRGDRQQLYRRQLDQLDATPIAGTEGGARPFLSPDGQWVGFYANGALKKVPFAGDAGATTICETTAIFGASWGANDTIAFARSSGGLWQVSAAGGAPQPLTRLDTKTNEVSHRLPQILPGGGAVLFTATQAVFPKWEDTRVVVQSLATGERRDLVQGADARYVPTGHIVYARSGALFAVPFDLKRMEVTGGAVNVIPDVMQAAYMPNLANDSGAAQFSVSASGTLAYLSGGMFPDLERSLVWVDRAGVTEPLAAPLRAYFAPRLSPDGQRVAVWTSGTDRNVWVYDVPRGTLSPLTTEGRNSYGVWTPDGKRITFISDLGGGGKLLWKPADGTGTAERLTSSEDVGIPSSWSPDGQTLAFSFRNDIFALSIVGDRRPRPVVQSRFAKIHPEFSSDGRWLAYVSDESGRGEVYVQPYPGPGPRQQVSIDGGSGPAWSKDGRELFYQVMSQGAGETLGLLKVMAVTITTHPTFSVGIPKMLFQRRAPLTGLGVRGYDVTPDGRRFLMVQDKERPPLKATEMILVQNWTEELKRLVPTR